VQRCPDHMKLKDWRQVKVRLTRMDREELRDRVRQELSKRKDAMLSRLGFDFAGSLRNSSFSKPGYFFFGPDSIDSLVVLLRQRLPGHAEQIVKQAEKICRHRFDLLGYQDLDYSSVIDWHIDPVHGKRAPLRPFYKMRYLDFEESGDSKITWELNRHQHFVTLAKAYRLTGNPQFADELLRQWRQWQADNPYPVGINWASSLEVAFRSLSWIWSYHLVAGARSLANLRDEWLPSLAQHGRHIERYLSTYFSPNTHLLGEGVGLFFLGVLCPELAGAERWKWLGLDIIVRESGRQVRADGFHFERSTYYHVYALDFFLHSAVLASVNNIPIPKSLEQALEKMLTALCLLGRCGSPPRFGDDDGGRLFDPRRNRSEHLLDPLATGAILFHRGDLKRVAGNLREETIWLLGAEGVRRWDELESTPHQMEATALKDSGFYLLTAAKPPAQLVLDAGPQGTQSGGHSHADALSISLQSHASLLIDPGTCQYVERGGDRDLFRGTAMHNTLRVDGTNQADPAGPFSWTRLAQTKVEQWIQGPGFDLLVASHDGYQRLPQPVTHRRWVVSLKNGLYLVRDVVEGRGRHRLDISWHLGQDMQLVGQNVFRVKGASQGLALVPAQGHGWAEGVRNESWSPVYGQKAPMTVLNFGAIAELPTEFVVMLVVLEEIHPGVRSLTRISSSESDSAVSAYHYAGEAGEYSFFFGEPGNPWRQNSVSSDAEFVCWSRKPGREDHLLILVNGSYTEIEGMPELRCRKAVRWCELVVQSGRRTVWSSNPEAVKATPDDSGQQEAPLNRGGA
jgi:heparinase II/III-like protein